MPSLEEKEERVTVEDEDPQKLVASRKKFWTNLALIGVILLLIIAAWLCNFVIPGLPDTVLQFEGMVFMMVIVFMSMNMEELGLASPQTDDEPKPLTVEMPSSEERVTAEDEERQKLIASLEKQHRTDLGIMCVILGIIFIIVSLLCSFLIPGISKQARDNLWQYAAMVFIVTAIVVGKLVMDSKESGSSSPQTDEEPKPLTGADLC